MLTEFNSDFNSDLMKGKDIDLYSWASYQCFEAIFVSYDCAHMWKDLRTTCWYRSLCPHFRWLIYQFLISFYNWLERSGFTGLHLPLASFRFSLNTVLSYNFGGNFLFNFKSEQPEIWHLVTCEHAHIDVVLPNS